MSNSPDHQTQEMEVTLLICSENPERVARSIARLTAIGDYRLVSRAIRDTYLDTKDRRLRRNQVSIRLREMDGQPLVTFKGPAEHLAWGGESRLEIEEPWSVAAVEAIIPRLGLSDLDPAKPKIDPSASPIATLATLGLKPVQVRENRREVRDLMRQDGPDAAVAELVIDSVTYRFGETPVRHLEVEIESKVANDSAALEEASRGLLDTYAPELRIWHYGKLTTGATIQGLLSGGGANKLIGSGGYLRPAAYAAVEALLGRR